MNHYLTQNYLTEDKGDPAHVMKIFEGEVVRLHSFLHSALDEDGVGSFTSGPLHPGDPPPPDGPQSQLFPNHQRRIFRGSFITHTGAESALSATSIRWSFSGARRPDA